MEIGLTPQDIYELEKAAHSIRKEYGNAPLGESLFRIIRGLGIHLIYWPIPSSRENENPFRAVYLSTSLTKKNNDKVRFIAINSNDYLDRILFSLGHELYHYYEDTDLDIFRNDDEESMEYREKRANRFSAELLLPRESLVMELKEWNDGIEKIHDWNYQKMFRFIAYIQCQYWVPYKCIIRRLKEIGSITEEQVEVLWREEARNPNSTYYKIALKVDEEVFKKLNTPYAKKGIEQSNLEIILRNYEEGNLEEEELQQDLILFEKKPADYGIISPIDSEDLAELEEMFKAIEEN